MDHHCSICGETANWIVWDPNTDPYTEYLMCDEDAAEAEANGWPYQQIKTEAQYDALIAWNADGAGVN